MKQHPLCTDPDNGPTIMDLPIAEGMKAEWAELETRRHFLGRAGKVLGWAALILQLILLIRLIQSQGATLLEAVWRFVGYFTILTNIAAAVVTVVAHRSGSALADALMSTYVLSRH